MKVREKIFQHAESILISNQVPIVPLFFYAGVTYFDTNKIQGIYPNVLDDHPLEYIRKIKPLETAHSIGSATAAGP